MEEKCDMSMGKWVREPKGPVYTNTTCPTLPDFKNCQKHGKDPGHLYWRWQPHGCDLPRFSPDRFLAAVRGKRLAFIGDSLARNQMDSLLCLLSQVYHRTRFEISVISPPPVCSNLARNFRLFTNFCESGQILFKFSQIFK